MFNVLKLFLGLNRLQRFILITLTICIVIANIIPFFINRPVPFNINFSTAQKQIDSMLWVEENKFSYSHKEKYYNDFNIDKNNITPNNNIGIKMFYFNPNTLDIAGWQNLGVSEKMANSIHKYTTKGGRFKTKQDLKKIYGMTENLYSTLAPFVIIEELKKEIDLIQPINIVPKKIISVDINTNQISEWEALKGIGIKIANRIIEYKNTLGGFYSIEQIKEVYGITDTLFNNIRSQLFLNATRLNKININTTTEDELKKHPYIKYKLAKLIIAYRQQHGDFKSIEDIKNIKLVEQDIFDKIKFYITTN